MQPLAIAQYRSIVVLTGAGVSVASGIRPFRGPGGLWEEGDNLRVANPSILVEDPLAPWRIFGPLRRQLRTAQPNAAHYRLAQLEAQLNAEQQFLLITQNIDGLHQRAGSHRVVELHGSIHRTRCSNQACDLPSHVDEDSHEELLPRCPRCQAPLRLDTVMFGEPIAVEAEQQVKTALRDCDLFLAIGTSGTVTPAANYVRSADYAGARTGLINLEPMVPRNPYFHEEYPGRAEEILPVLFP